MNNLKKIGDFLHERMGRYKPSDKRIIGLKRINKIDFAGKIHLSDKNSKTDMIMVCPGDIVISGINVSKGAIAAYFGSSPVVATIHYSAYSVDEKQINIEFFKRFIKSSLFEQIIKEQVRGGIKTEIKPKNFLPLEIFLPDIDTQKKIALYLENIESKILHLRNEIGLQEISINKLRQQILQDAIEGKLTADWRKNNPSLITGENHASKLLEKIKVEKARLIKEGKLKKEKHLPPITEAEKPFPLPKGWTWCRVGELGIVNPRNELKEDINVSFFPMKLIPSEYGVSPKFEIRQWGKIRRGFTHVAENDVAIAKITPCFENSKACVFKGLMNNYGAGTTELHVLRPIFVHPDFIYTCFKTSVFLNNGERVMTGACGQKRVPLSYFINSVVALPPILEQNLIIDYSKKLMLKIAEFEYRISKSEILLEDMMQSVLTDAFNGEKNVSFKKNIIFSIVKS